VGLGLIELAQGDKRQILVNMLMNIKYLLATFVIMFIVEQQVANKDRVCNTVEREISKHYI
jgi:hypothetical protein